ncbi:MAG: hypothetical protein Q8L44_07960 [Sulfuritalea sp.]|nr:hypothetical protein [Sulfuritalea sp.]
MIDFMRGKAKLIEDELWKIAKTEFGLEPTAETLNRVGATLLRARNTKEIQIDPNIEDVDWCFASGIVMATIAQTEESPQRTLDFLLSARDHLAMLTTYLITDKHPCESPQVHSVKEMATGLARRRHAENYALVDDAVKYWRERIDPNLSAAKAANELVRVVPLSHKKLAEVVSAEKKKQH